MSQTAVVDFEEKVRKSYKVQLYLKLWISKTQQQSLIHLLFSVCVQTTKNSPVICLGTYRFFYQLAKNNRLVRKMLLTCNLISELVCQPQYELCTHSEKRIDYTIYHLSSRVNIFSGYMLHIYFISYYRIKQLVFQNTQKISINRISWLICRRKGCFKGYRQHRRNCECWVFITQHLGKLVINIMQEASWKNFIYIKIHCLKIVE